jgi:hypothetical protein
MRPRFHRRTFLVLFAAGMLAASGVARAQTPPPERFRASIESVDGNTVNLLTRGGEKVFVSLTPETTYVAIVPIALEAIQPGAYVGSTAVPGPDGTLRALEVHVFPERMRGAGEGHRPFDLQPQSTMTNGTVGAVTGTTARTLTVTYQGEAKTIVVSPETPVVTYEPADASMLQPKAHVIAMARRGADGKLSATRFSIGKNGLIPPM